jgi:hypothetical protein
MVAVLVAQGPGMPPLARIEKSRPLRRGLPDIGAPDTHGVIVITGTESLRGSRNDTL